MSLEEGEVYRCEHEGCGCEILVTAGAGPEGGEEPPRCCCGRDMSRIEHSPVEAR